MILLIMVILGVILVILNVIFNKKYLMIAIIGIVICIPVYLFITLPNGYSVEEANIESKSLADSISKLSKEKGIDITEFAKIKISGNIDTLRPITELKDSSLIFKTYTTESKETISCDYNKNTSIHGEMELFKNVAEADKWYKMYKEIYSAQFKTVLVNFEEKGNGIYVSEVNDIKNNSHITAVIFQKQNFVINLYETRKYGQPSDLKEYLKNLAAGFKRLGTKQ